MTERMSRMYNHGHVTPNSDGSRERCGGSHICSVCALEQAQKDTPDPSAVAAKYPENIRCPFCGEYDFDLIGLKIHLNNNCEDFRVLTLGSEG
jgi:hypothetical protein